MGASTQIAGKDLRLRIRDKSAFIIGIVAPLALAFIINLVFGTTFEDDSLDLRYGMVDLDRSEVSQAFTGLLEGVAAEGILEMSEYSSATEAEAAVEADEIDAYYLVEPGLGDAVFSQAPYTIQVVGDVDAPTSTQIATSIAEQFGLGVTTAQLSVQTAAAMSATPPTGAEIGAWVEQAAQTGQPFALADVSAATRQMDTTTYFAAGMAVFFLFFTVQFGVLGLLEEEQDGTLNRLLAAPIRRTSVIMGKAILSFTLGVVSMAVLVITTQLLMGAQWGSPLGVALLVMAGVLCAVGIMGMVASIAKTPEGAGNLGAIIAVILGMLGGVFFPLGQGDDFLSRLTYITPHAWFMRGLGDLAGEAPWTAALPAMLALLAFALTTGLVAWVFLQRRFQR